MVIIYNTKKITWYGVFNVESNQTNKQDLIKNYEL